MEHFARPQLLAPMGERRMGVSGGIILGFTAHAGMHAFPWAVTPKGLGHKIPYGVLRPKNFCINAPDGRFR
jgi:hypothetical protein